MQYVKWSTHLFVALILLIVGLNPALANDKRVALLIANKNYATSPLKNPINDARLIESKLKQLDYKVTVLTDANRYQMIEKIEAFGRDAQGADSAVFYYSGYGMQDDYRQNYLLPVDATISSEANIRGYGVEAYEVINALKKAKPRISLVIFDACRDNPFAGVRGNRNFSVEAYRTDNEMLESYATQTGQYAQDGQGNNSPYAIALAEQLGQAEQTPLLLMFDRVQDRVKDLTNNKQRPTKMGDAKTTTFLVGQSASQPVPLPITQNPTPILPTPPSPDESSKSKIHAVIIGIEDYALNSNCKLCKNDAYAINEQLLKSTDGLYNLGEIVLLTNTSQTSKKNIFNSLTQIKNKVGEQDLFVFYFSGFGHSIDDNQHYILPSNVQLLSGFSDSAINLMELEEAIKNIPTNKKLVLLDVSSMTGMLNTSALDNGISDDFGAMYVNSGARIASPEHNNGLFAYAVLQGLKGDADKNGDLYVDSRELFSYLENEIPKASMIEHRKAMYPMISISGSTFQISKSSLIRLK